MLGKKYLAWKGPLVLVYIAMIVCTVIFINNNNGRLIEQSSFSSYERSKRIENLQKECEKLKQQVRDSSYPYSEYQYPLQAIFHPPQINITRINEEYKIAVCVPYKAGSETWRYLLRSLNNDTINNNSDTNSDIPKSWDQIQDYHKVIQVRNPYERLLSAYRFTFQNKNRMRDNLQLNKILLETYSHLPHSQDEDDQPVASFPQFVQSIVSGYKDLPHDKSSLLTSGAALHWLPYYIQCNPCHQVYRPDTIIYMDTWTDDTSLLLNTTGVGTNRTFYLLNSSPGGHSSDPELLRQYYSQISRDNINNLADIYHMDFKLFGFDKDSIFNVLDGNNT